MPLLTVTGGPIAPTGHTLLSTTRLVVTYESPYVDVDKVYPTTYIATYDVTNNKWKPQNTVDGTPFLLPGATVGDVLPPPCKMFEVQEYSVQVPLSFFRGPLRILETVGAGTNVWHYGDPGKDAIYYAGFPPNPAPYSQYHGSVNADGTGRLLPIGWSCSRIGAGEYDVVHNLDTYDLTIQVTPTDTLQVRSITTSRQSVNMFKVYIRNPQVTDMPFVDDRFDFMVTVP